MRRLVVLVVEDHQALREAVADLVKDCTPERLLAVLDGAVALAGSRPGRPPGPGSSPPGQGRSQAKTK